MIKEGFLLTGVLELRSVQWVGDMNKLRGTSRCKSCSRRKPDTQRRSQVMVVGASCIRSTRLETQQRLEGPVCTGPRKDAVLYLQRDRKRVKRACVMVTTTLAVNGLEGSNSRGRGETS